LRPTREHATNAGHTYMITSQTWGRRDLFSKERWAQLLIDTIYHYRGTAYLLHAFVVMPDHIHVLLTPETSLEKTVQFIKGGFSYRAKKEMGSNMEVWQKGFSDHRIRDLADYDGHVVFIYENPVRKRFCERASEFPYSSAHSGFELDPVPQGLKPRSAVETGAARLEAAPLQSNALGAKGVEAAPLRSNALGAASVEAALLQSKGPTGAAEPTQFQSNNRKTAS
jgi:putative transposase